VIVRICRSEFRNFSTYYIFSDKWIIFQSALKIYQRSVLNQNALAWIGLQAARQHTNAAIKAAFEPCIMTDRQLTGLAFIFG
jgi:hypothetical protein